MRYGPDPEFCSRAIRSHLLASLGLPDTEEHLANKEVGDICEEFKIALSLLPATENPDELMKFRTARLIEAEAHRRLVSNILPKAAANGDLECAWGDEDNQPVFWMEKEPATQIGRLLAHLVFRNEEPPQTRPKPKRTRSIWTRSNKLKLVSKIAEMFPYREENAPLSFAPMTTPTPTSKEFKEFAERNGVEVVFAKGGIWRLADGTPAVNCRTHVITENPWGPLRDTGLRIPREVARSILKGETRPQ